MNERMEVKQVIDVTHECNDGWHTFTSEHIPGLFLTAHEADLETAFYDIPRAIELLVHADYGKKVKVEPQVTFNEYLKTLPETHKPKRRTRHYTIETMPLAA